MRVVFSVTGRPVPQGSMTASYNRKLGVAHVHHVQGAALALWRSEIREAAIKAGASRILRPVRIEIEFGMPRPKAQLELKHGKYRVRPRYWYARPATAPDLDKLIRAVLDALTLICYHDDSQVIEISATKLFGEETSIVVTDEVEHPQQAFTFGVD